MVEPSDVEYFTPDGPKRSRLRRLAYAFLRWLDEMILALCTAVDGDHELSRAELASRLELSDAQLLQIMIGIFPRCTECGLAVHPDDWNARFSPTRERRVAHVVCPIEQPTFTRSASGDH